MKSTFFYLCSYLPYPCSHAQNCTVPWGSVIHWCCWQEAPLSIEAVFFCCVHSASVFLCVSRYKTHAKWSQLKSKVITFKFTVQSNRVFFLNISDNAFIKMGHSSVYSVCCSWQWPLLGATTAAVGSNGLNMSTVKDSSLIALVWGLFYALIGGVEPKRPQYTFLSKVRAPKSISLQEGCLSAFLNQSLS